MVCVFIRVVEDADPYGEGVSGADSRGRLSPTDLWVAIWIEVGFRFVKILV